MRSRTRIVLGMIGALIASTLAVAPAVAMPPPELTAYVTDRAGSLSTGQLAAANERLKKLVDGDGGELFIVIVKNFDNPSDRVEWADDTAQLNGLGPDQYLLAVAVEQRTYYISADQNGPIDGNRVRQIEQVIKPLLSDADYAGAIATAADEFEAANTAPAFDGFTIFLLIAVVIAVIILIWALLRARKKKQAVAGPRRTSSEPEDPNANVSNEELARRAGSALVDADNAITASKEDLGFASAQYGDEATAPFTKTVEAAKARVSEAFALKQQIDDEVPDTLEQQRTWNIEILRLCDEARTLLEENVAAYDALRKIEENAPQALERVSTQRTAVQQSLAAAPAALAALTSTYDAATLSTVAENPKHAEERLQLADSEIASATKDLAEGRASEAAFGIRTAEEAVTQADQLVKAVTSLGTDLAAIENRAKQLIAELEADLAAAAQMPDPQAQIAPVIASTRTQLDQARTNLTSSARSPQRMLDVLDAANTQIDTVLAQSRDAAERSQRSRQLLEQRLLQAQAQISAANEFISTRRGAVGATPRTRLAEASAALNQAFALQGSDPEQALSHATRSLQLAQEATSLADSEVSSFDAGGFGALGGGSGPDVGSMILGGLLGGILSGGGGGGGGGFGGGGGWRSSGGGRGFSPSSFGGGRGRAGGGRF